MDAVAAIVLLMILVLGIIQVALTLYGRNVVDASAHEGLRAIVERGAITSNGERVATSMVRLALQTRRSQQLSQTEDYPTHVRARRSSD